jgi:hypothetical protein
VLGLMAAFRLVLLGRIDGKAAIASAVAQRRAPSQRRSLVLGSWSSSNAVAPRLTADAPAPD